jgi:nucleotide-binding universal stress UspA family protein
VLSRSDAARPSVSSNDDRQSSDGKKFQTILVATDGSSASQDAIGFAVELAAEHQSEVHIVHVIPTIDLAPAIAIGEEGIAFPHEPTEYDYRLLEEAAALANTHGVAATTALLGGSTAEEIVAYAEANNVDMIVVGSNGRGAITSALLGSVSLGVLAASKRPVVIVHGASPFHSGPTEVPTHR